MVERRTETRNRSYLGARIAFNGLSTLDCAVRNLSPRGARLTCLQGVTPPYGFTLEIANLAWKRRGRVVWTGIDACGVEFLDEIPGAKPR